MDRKLAAILAADVVGYSKLMEKDERGTYERLRAGRKELFEPEIARHHGRIFKVMGDGMLAEFGSVVDAVECAVITQHGLHFEKVVAGAATTGGHCGRRISAASMPSPAFLGMCGSSPL